MKPLKPLLFLLFLVIGKLSFAQVYPVQATVQLTPPYSLYLADYVESGTERLALNIFLADIARPQLDVRFRLRIVGQGVTIETKPEYRPAPVSIQGGVPLRLISTDLADYFNSNNLNFQGITRREYDQRGKLPEGVYQFCFEVLEYNRGAKISNTACGTAWMILNDPPIVNLPRQNEKLKVQSPQNILLQWTPRHTGSPNSAFTTNYDVTMVEVWPSTRNPNDAILTSPPIFETTTSSTTVVYGPAETPLEPGRRYAFRVRARSIAGVDELDLFKNNGYSEVISFVYGDACDLPTGINASSIGTSKFSLAWDGLFNHTAYKVHYREAGTTNWYESDVTSTNADIYSLKPGTVYEYQVAATCGFYDGQYSAIAKVTTNPLPEAEYACGAPLGTFNIDPKELTGSLKVGDIIQAGDFDVKLTKVTGSNGVFSGEGVIEVPYFNKAKVKTSFSDISVTKELRMVNGYMNVTGAAVDIIPAGVMDAVNGLTEILNAADSALNTIEENLPEQFDPNSFVADTAINVKNGISSVYKDDDGTVVIVDSKGTETRLPAGTSAAVTDSSGSGYLVDKKGNVHKVTAEVAAKAANREYNLSLKFAANAGMQYGFDQRKYDAIGKDYEQLKNYSVAWKSVASGGVTDVVTAILSGTGIDAGKIKFEQSGIALQAQPFANNQTTLSVRGGSDGTEEGLLALYSAADTGKVQVLGKLNVVSYNKISNSVVIVPVNNTSLPSGLTPQIIEDSLNAIYKQSVVDWKVSIASPIDVALGDPFDDGDSELLSNYTDDMKKVIKAFGKLQDETFYLFLVNNPKSGDGLGYMPRGKQAGFIFVDRHGSDKSALMRTMAHELGHGAFSLHHTFKEPNFTLTKGTTDNLMDYPSGNKLYKYQWDKMRYPDIVVGLFEEDEEGEQVLVQNISDLKPFAENGLFTFITPTGKPFSLPTDIQEVTFYSNDESNGSTDIGFYPDGALRGFKLADGQKYVAYLNTNNKKEFLGYYLNKDQPSPYLDKSTKSKGTVTKVIAGFPCVEEGKISFKVKQCDFTGDQISSDNSGRGTYNTTLPIQMGAANEVTLKYISTTPYGELATAFLEKITSCQESETKYILTLANVINANEAYVKACPFSTLLKSDIERWAQPFLNPACTTCVNTVYKPVKMTESDFLAKLTEFVKSLKDFQNKPAELAKITTASSMRSALRNTALCNYWEFDAALRFHILDLLRKETMNNCNGPVLDNCAEEFAIDVLKLVKEDKVATDLVKLLSEDKTGVLKDLNYRIDGEEFGEYHIALSELYSKAKASEFEKLRKTLDEKSLVRGDLQQHANNGNFWWSDYRFLKRLINIFNRNVVQINYYDTDISKEGKITFKADIVASPTVPDANVEILDPFTLIKINFISDGQSLPYARGDSAYLPAINILAITNDQFNGQTIDAINVAFILGTFGSGSIGAAGWTTIGLSSVALTVDSYRGEIRQLPYGPEFLKGWEILNQALIVYQSYHIITGIPGAVKGALDSYKRVRPYLKASTREAMDETVNNTVRQTERSTGAKREYDPNQYSEFLDTPENLPGSGADPVIGGGASGAATSNVSKLGVGQSLKVAKGSKGRALIDESVADDVIDAKEIDFSDKIGDAMGEDIVHPKQRDYPSIDAVSKETGTPLSYKQLTEEVKSNITKNINNAYKSIANNNARALKGEVWKDGVKFTEWKGVDLHIEYKFSDVDANWLKNKMWPAFKKSTQRAFQNNGLIKDVYIHLQDGSVVQMDMSIF